MSCMPTRLADGVRSVVLSLATAAVAYFTRLNPLWLFAAAGALGYLGLI